MQLRLFAPFLPFVTEEVWAWWQEGSVHRAAWPTTDEVARIAQDGEPILVAEVADVLSAIRKAKSEAKVSMRAEVAYAEIALPAGSAARVQQAAGDLAAAGRIADLRIVEGTAEHPDRPGPPHPRSPGGAPGSPPALAPPAQPGRRAGFTTPAGLPAGHGATRPAHHPRWGPRRSPGRRAADPCPGA